MEKACRKPAVKSSSMRLFNLVISPKQPAHLWDFQKKIFFKRDREKVNLIFAFAPSDFLRQNFEKQKCLELVTSLFDLQYMPAKIPALVLPFESENCGEGKKNYKRLSKWRQKTFFKIFKMLSSGKIWKTKDASFKFKYSDSY